MIDDVQRLCSILDIGEEAMFKRAVEVWTGSPDDELAMRHADEYMRTGYVPPFIRQLSRQTPDIPDDYTQQFIKMMRRWVNFMD